MLLHAEDKLTEAQSCLEQALAIREQKLAEHHPEPASKLSNLGTLTQVEGKEAEARFYFEQALATYELQLRCPSSDNKSLAR
jgi:tetratricopeptide (TPR) repeat protein